MGGLIDYEFKEALLFRFFAITISSISQIKWNVLKIYFLEISFNLKPKTNIFKYFDDVLPKFVNLFSVKIS